MIAEIIPDRQTDKETDIETDRQIHKHTHTHMSYSTPHLPTPTAPSHVPPSHTTIDTVIDNVAYKNITPNSDYMIVNRKLPNVTN